MSIGIATETRSVGKKTEQPAPEFERIEFQAPPGFLKQLDRARKKLGLSRSAYLRQAALMRIAEDLKKETESN